MKDVAGAGCHATELDGSGEVIYYNGAIGSQIGNRGPVWEVSEQFPIVGTLLTAASSFAAGWLAGGALTMWLRRTCNVDAGDGGQLPPGAVEVPDNFRNAFLIGQQLAIAVRLATAPIVGGVGALTACCALHVLARAMIRSPRRPPPRRSRRRRSSTARPRRSPA